MTIMCSGRSFTVTQSTDGSFEVAEMDRPVGVFSIDSSGRVTLRGWYANADDAEEITLDVGRRFAATRLLAS